MERMTRLPGGKMSRATSPHIAWTGVVSRWKIPTVIAFLWLLSACQTDSEEGPSSVAVLPFSNASADPQESDYLAEGINQSVITRLAQVGLRVTPWESVRRYRDSQAEPQTIARELKVDAVLLGTFQLEGDRILTRLTLMDADSGFIAWAEEYEEPYADLFQVQRRIAQGVASSLMRSLSGEEEELLAAPESGSVEAYDSYLQGASVMQEGTRDATEVAFEYFSRALELDPNLVGAHLGLGAVYNTRYYWGWGSGPSSLERAAASYERALALDPESMVARRGLVLLHFFKGQSEAVLQQGKWAAQIGRADDPEALLTRALAYQMGGLPCLSLDLYRRVLEIDPGHPEAHYQYVFALRLCGDNQRAVGAGHDFLRRFGDDSDVHGHLGGAYRALAQAERAREHYLMASRGEPHPWVYGAAGLFLDALGERDRAVDLWKRGAASVEANLAANPDHVGMRSFLAVFRGLINREGAFIEEAVRAYEAAGYYSWELENLMEAKVALGDSDGTIEILRARVRQGRLPLEGDLAETISKLPESEALRQLRIEHEALKTRYLERYGSDERPQ